MLVGIGSNVTRSEMVDGVGIEFGGESGLVEVETEIEAETQTETESGSEIAAARGCEGIAVVVPWREIVDRCLTLVPRGVT